VTIRDWLDARTPAPPTRLRARIDEMLADYVLQPTSDMTADMIAVAEATLRELLARPSAGRESALDLLAIDALTTYAFEAAAAEPEQLAARSNDAMLRFSALA
jgi:hypothetical protein